MCVPRTTPWAQIRGIVPALSCHWLGSQWPARSERWLRLLVKGNSRHHKVVCEVRSKRISPALWTRSCRSCCAADPLWIFPRNERCMCRNTAVSRVDERKKTNKPAMILFACRFRVTLPSKPPKKPVYFTFWHLTAADKEFRQKHRWTSTIITSE